MRGPAVGVGDGVVDVAIERGPIAAGPAAGEIPAAHEIGELLRRHISRLGRGIDRMDQGHQLGLGGQLGDEFGCDRARLRIPRMPLRRCGRRAWLVRRSHGSPQAWRRAAFQRCSHRIRSRQPSRSAPGRERSQCVGTALLASAWIALAHRAGQRSEPLVPGHEHRGSTGCREFPTSHPRDRRTRPRVRCVAAYGGGPHRRRPWQRSCQSVRPAGRESSMASAPRSGPADHRRSQADLGQ